MPNLDTKSPPRNRRALQVSITPIVRPLGMYCRIFIGLRVCAGAPAALNGPAAGPAKTRAFPRVRPGREPPLKHGPFPALGRPGAAAKHGLFPGLGRPGAAAKHGYSLRWAVRCPTRRRAPARKRSVGRPHEALRPGRCYTCVVPAA
ncbi:hypothetical protein ACFLVY_00340 [Chloroflexota bacterium]